MTWILLKLPAGRRAGNDNSARVGYDVGMDPAFSITPAHPDELTAALRLAFRHHEPETRLARVAVGLDLIDRGELDPTGVLVARAGDRLIGAMVAAPVPGGAAAVWPPQVEPEAPAAIADALAVHAVAWLRDQGVKMAQVLLGPEDLPLAGPLLHAGFRHTTTLLYLRHFLEDLPTDLIAAAERLTYTAFTDSDPAPFAAALGRTYENTQDCPEISGARSPTEALAGHQAGGFNPATWWLASANGAPAGVLLVNPSPDDDGWEVAYVGVVPEFRRRGFGHELMVKAILEAKAAGQECLALAVDARNQPARAMYERLGFEQHETRDVLLAVWR
jgi:ribosomal protein S18 acetylase RimI-like enzyme